LVIDNYYLHKKAISRGDAEVAEQSKTKLEKNKSFWLLAVVPVSDSVFSAFSASPREYGFEFSSD